MSSQKWIDENQDKLRQYKRKYYLANKQKYVSEAAARKKELKKWFEAIKADFQCVLCKEKESVCLDFHHTDPNEKDVDISRAIMNGWSRKRIMDEIQKCVCLCCKCHRKLHAGLISIRDVNGSMRPSQGLRVGSNPIGCSNASMV